MSSNSRYLFIPILCLLLSPLAACSSKSGNWGGNTTLNPGWETLGKALKTAATDRQTWIPLAGAMAFSIDDLDQQTVEWAGETTALFASRGNAKDASDDLSDLAKLNLLTSIVLLPSDQYGEGPGNKTSGLAMTPAALATTHAITKKIKSASDRQRPNHRDRRSFPSGHTSGAASAASLAYSNIEQMPGLTMARKKIWQYSGYTIAGLTGWARVEANLHYPSDVLAGYALGNFIGRFFSEAFIDPRKDPDLGVQVLVDMNQSLKLVLDYRF